MIELIPPTSTFHVLYDLTTWGDSVIPIHYAKPKVTQEVSSAHDSYSGMMQGKPKIFPLQHSFRQWEKSFSSLVLLILTKRKFSVSRFLKKQVHGLILNATQIWSNPKRSAHKAWLGYRLPPPLYSSSSFPSILFPLRKLLNMFCFCKTRKT